MVRCSLVSRRFDAAQVESRLTALLHMREDEWDWAPIEAARAVGAALRAEAPERVRSAALLWAERTVDGALPSTTLRQRLCAIMPVSALPGRTTAKSLRRRSGSDPRDRRRAGGRL
jgi:hypothetical protein